MAYFIRTDTKNMLQSVQKGQIRIPRRLKHEADLSRIKRGDSIFLYDYEGGCVHGPLFSCSSKVMEEKNPDSGPFNGQTGIARYFIYDSIEVDCSKMFPKGCPLEETTFNPAGTGFYMTEENEKLLTSKLCYFNTRTQPIIINTVCLEDSLHVTVIEWGEGMEVSNIAVDKWQRFYEQVQDMKRTGEELLCRDDKESFYDILNRIGICIYKRLVGPLGLDRLHTEGGYRIYISGMENCFDMPFEISFDNEFIFERNIISYSAGRSRCVKPVEVKKILVLADPSDTCIQAYREGERLYNYFLKSGFHIDLLSRPLQNYLLTDLLSEYDIVHFCGHHNAENTDNGWEIGYSKFTAGDLALVKCPPSLVVSSTCGNSLEMGYDMIRRGVANAISSRWQIPDRNMGEFFITFYKSLFNKMDIGYSFSRAVQDAYKRGDVIPLTFVLQGESRMIYEKKNS